MITTTRPVHFGRPTACKRGSPHVTSTDTPGETTCKHCRVAIGLDPGPHNVFARGLNVAPRCAHECVGQALARWRVAHGLDQTQAAERIDVARQSFAQREQGTVDIAVRELLHLCKSGDEAADLVRAAFVAWEGIR